jgi:hypothetical protein
MEPRPETRQQGQGRRVASRGLRGTLANRTEERDGVESCVEYTRPPNALVQLQAHYHHCGEAASEDVLVCCNATLGGAPLSVRCEAVRVQLWVDCVRKGFDMRRPSITIA